ncbi:MAG: SRPBCC family protein [Chitinophagaceae bacterium]|nr:SRPBCC family protein [Chitinophagaceae bacterium]
MSKVYSLKAIQKIPVDINIAWEFFSNANNLALITPVNMRFKIISQHNNSDKLYPGQIIEYTVKPLLGIPLYWMTEITHLQDKKYFTDEQRFGPFSFWHHQHHFAPIVGGIEMIDIVHYKLPLWWLGSMANALFVKKQLNDLFYYRSNKIVELFGVL